MNCGTLEDEMEKITTSGKVNLRDYNEIKGKNECGLGQEVEKVEKISIFLTVLTKHGPIPFWKLLPNQEMASHDPCRQPMDTYFDYFTLELIWTMDPVFWYKAAHQ